MTVRVSRPIIEIILDHEHGIECVACQLRLTERLDPGPVQFGSGFKWSTLKAELVKDSILDTTSVTMV